ncbi:hypothetical protein BTA51_02570 [Hahella sp. CCB-MM4]|uniref:STAS domain-containing protein n=1 Tax=Hahella sp. (strain CCB-MM4) TaxID=1926491 RepID=UPI000B9B6311|nr:STAS domain-containing protein [Hahella sp. CCB-MM4]OZG75287.1 hypothetical protein BTA51_02570 [Hahella sp. CCB-MM4]
MSRSKNTPLKLPANLTIANIEALHEQLKAKEFEKKLVLDASNVEVVDTAGVQLLLAAQRRLEAGGGLLDWKAGSEVLKQAIKVVGLEDTIVI